MIKLLVPVFLCLIFGLPFAAAGYPILAAHHDALRLAMLMAAPVVFGVSYLLISGTLSLPFQRAIVAGKFPRSLTHPVYGPRRLYGLCWTAIYYFPPLYWAALTVPALKAGLLRLFGYRGSMNITIYPDTWIRDLPLLKLGDGAYISNKATLGTNICLKDGNILVDSVEVEKGGLIGHLTMLAPGATIGQDAEIGVGVAYGIRARAKAGSKVGPGALINHGVEIGVKSEVGSMSYVGIRAVIRDGIKVPGGANIPSGAVINSQEEMNQFISSETSLLQEAREKMRDILRREIDSQSRSLHLVTAGADGT